MADIIKELISAQKDLHVQDTKEPTQSDMVSNIEYFGKKNLVDLTGELSMPLVDLLVEDEQKSTVFESFKMETPSQENVTQKPSVSGSP